LKRPDACTTTSAPARAFPSPDDRARAAAATHHCRSRCGGHRRDISSGNRLRPPIKGRHHPPSPHRTANEHPHILPKLHRAAAPSTAAPLCPPPPIHLLASS
jgi:hypothetical protein